MSTIGSGASALIGRSLQVAAFLYLIYYATPRPSSFQVDVPQFYAVGHIIRDGKIADIYDRSSYAAFAHLEHKGGSIYYNRPPFHALFMLPFGFMDFGTFLLVIRILTYASLPLGVWLIQKWFPGPAHTVALFLFFKPFGSSITVGQDTIFLAIILAFGAYLIVRKNQELAGGIVLALGLFKPHLLLAIPFALAAQKKWKTLAGFSACGAVLGLLSFALIGPHGVAEWITVLKAPSTDMRIDYMGNLRAIALSMGHGSAVIVGIVSVASFAVCIVRGSLRSALGAAFMISPLLTPHSYITDYTPAAVSAVLSPSAALSYLVLIPWQLAWPEPHLTAIPYAFTAAVYLSVLACWTMTNRLCSRRCPHIRDEQVPVQTASRVA